MELGKSVVTHLRSNHTIFLSDYPYSSFPDRSVKWKEFKKKLPGGP
jgi:hypothetical protein